MQIQSGRTVPLNTEGEEYESLKMVWEVGGGGGGSEGRSPWTYLKQGVGKRGGRFEPYILEASIKYVIWL
jgi:hypothetical protein